MRPSLKQILIGSLLFLLVVFEIVHLNYAQKIVDENLRDWVNRPNLKMDFESSTPSWIPGLVYVKKFMIEGHDGRVKWHVETDTMTAYISLPHLIFRRLNVLMARGEGGMVDIKLFQEKYEKPCLLV